jgi:hypothetical protein
MHSASNYTGGWQRSVVLKGARKREIMVYFKVRNSPGETEKNQNISG